MKKLFKIIFGLIAATVAASITLIAVHIIEAGGLNEAVKGLQGVPDGQASADRSFMASMSMIINYISTLFLAVVMQIAIFGTLGYLILNKLGFAKLRHYIVLGLILGALPIAIIFTGQGFMNYAENFSFILIFSIIPTIVATSVFWLAAVRTK